MTRITISTTASLPRPRAADALMRTMDRAGWALDWVDLDLTGGAQRLEIRATRRDGLWVRAYVDQLGRATLERVSIHAHPFQSRRPIPK